jgi:hypothetical protein
MKKVESSKPLATTSTNIGDIMKQKIMQRNTFTKFSTINSRNEIPNFEIKQQKQSIQRIVGPHIYGTSELRNKSNSFIKQGLGAENRQLSEVKCTDKE